MSTTTPSANGSSRHQHDKVRVAIIGVGNCASSFVQGVHYYQDADPSEPVPGLMHVDLGGYHVRDIEFSAAFDIDVEKVGKPLSRGDLRRPEQHAEVRRRGPGPRGRGDARDDPRRARQVPLGEDHQGPRADGRHRRGAEVDPHRRGRLLPAGRLRAGDQVVRRADPRGRLRLRQLHPRVHRPRGLLEQAASSRPGCRSSATTSSPRSARRSSIAASRGCSTTAASSCCAPRS